MPLTSPHVVASLVCVAAAAVMLAGARGRSVRSAHLVVLAVMVVLVVAMHSVPVVLGSAAVLSVTAVLLLGRSGEEAQHCALDTAVSGGLVMLMGLPLVLAATGHGVPAPGEHGMHAHVHALIPGQADHQVLLALLALGLVAGWVLGTRRLPTARRDLPVGFARWAMVLAMGAMVVTT